MTAGSLEKKLVSYALAGGAAVLAGGQVAEAAVVTVTPSSPLTITVPTGGETGSFDVDLDGDSLVDFRFSAFSYVSGGEVSSQTDQALVEGVNGGQIAGSSILVDSAFDGPGGIAALFGNVNDALASNPTLGKAKLLVRYDSGYTAVQDTAGDVGYVGNWQNGQVGTLGVRFMLGGVTPTMGFINARVDLGSVTITVDQWGYDDLTTPGVPEPGTVSLLALGAAGVAALRRRRQAAQ